MENLSEEQLNKLKEYFNIQTRLQYVILFKYDKGDTFETWLGRLTEDEIKILTRETYDEE